MLNARLYSVRPLATFTVYLDLVFQGISYDVVKYLKSGHFILQTKSSFMSGIQLASKLLIRVLSVLSVP